MRYPEAKAQALCGKGVLVSLAGGRKRYAVFTLDDDGVVQTRLFQTNIITFYPDGRIRLDSGGYHTPSTFDAIGAVYGARPWRDAKGALRLGQLLYGDGMVLGPADNILAAGAQSLTSPTGIKPMPRYTKTVCYGVEDGGIYVSKLGSAYAWPVLDFAGMTTANGLMPRYDLQLVPNSDIHYSDYPKSVRKDVVPLSVRNLHQAFWKEALTP